jgi:hypothetical protein
LALASLLIVQRPAVAAQVETIDRVLAVVAGRLIMLSDVTAARDLGLVPNVGASDSVRTVLNQLIDRELMLAEVERYAPPDPSPDALDREMAAVRARFDSPSAFDAILARTGIDSDHVRETLRQNLRIREYQAQRFVPSDPARQSRIEDWIAGLRRRGDIVDLYGSGQ